VRARGLVLALVVLAAAVAGATLVRDDEPSAIPWIDRPVGHPASEPPARLNVPPIPRQARLCREDDVRVTTDRPQPMGPVYSVWWIAVRNAGAGTCVIRGLPSLEIVSNDGGPIRVEEATGGIFTDPEYPATAPAFGLAPGRSAVANLVTSEDCSDPRRRRDERVVVRAGWARLVRLVLPTCASGVTIYLDAFEPPPLPEPRPIGWGSLRAELDAPAKLPPGRPSATG
jgi:Protein of unknown function (DUF4232)